jgi:hypothetical protein
MSPSDDGARLSDRPGAWTELALTLPIFLVYQLGVVFLSVRNATDLVTGRLLDLAHGDRVLYVGLTAAVGVILLATFAALGRGQGFRPAKVVQIASEGAAYAAAMSSATSWIVGKVFAGATLASTSGPLTGFVMSLGAGFYEELAFRVLLFGVGAKVLLWLLVRQKVEFVGRSQGGPTLRGVLIMGVWALVCAVAFSAMHYTGSMADAFDARSFVARAVLGLALTLIYAMRGFAAAVWTHALYDVWVLVL